MLDTETVHTIKEIHYREPSDIAIVELQSSVNNCSDGDVRAGKCWKITPVKLPPADVEIKENQIVRALGNLNLHTNCSGVCPHNICRLGFVFLGSGVRGSV